MSKQQLLVEIKETLKRRPSFAKRRSPMRSTSGIRSPLLTAKRLTQCKTVGDLEALPKWMLELSKRHGRPRGAVLAAESAFWVTGADYVIDGGARIKRNKPRSD